MKVRVQISVDAQMKALSLMQPMAWAIFNGKDVENRKWSTKFRGKIYIHASRNFNKEHYEWIAQNENRLGCRLPQPDEFVYGAIIGEVEIVDCVKNHGSLWFFGPNAFVLKNPVLYDTPIPCRGMVGFFEPDIQRTV